MSPLHRQRHETEGLFLLKGKPGLGMCCVKGCRKDHGKHKFHLCHAHYQSRWRSLNKKQSAYRTLKDHAAARGIKFALGWDYFRGMLDSIAFLDHQAESRGEILTFDRISADRGYEEGNVRIITGAMNTAKGNRERHLPAVVQEIISRKREKAKSHPALAAEQDEPDERNPF